MPSLGQPSLFIVYFIHKFFRKFAKFELHQIARNFSLLGTTTIHRQQTTQLQWHFPFPLRMFIECFMQALGHYAYRFHQGQNTRKVNDNCNNRKEQANYNRKTNHNHNTRNNYQCGCGCQMSGPGSFIAVIPPKGSLWGAVKA